MGTEATHLYLATAMFLVIILYLLLKKKAERDRRNNEIAAIRLAVEASLMQLENQGLPPSIARSIPITKYSSGAPMASTADAGCVICLQEFEDGEEVCQLPTCSHFFHRTCIDQWFEKRNTCPICRVSLIAPPPAAAPVRVGPASTGCEAVLANRSVPAGTGAPVGPPLYSTGNPREAQYVRTYELAETAQVLPYPSYGPTGSNVGSSQASVGPQASSSVGPTAVPVSEEQRQPGGKAGGPGESTAGIPMFTGGGGDHWAIHIR